MVKRGFLMLMLAIAAASCDNSSPTAPADPNIVVFTAQLSAANEVPPVVDEEKDARGNVRITVNLTRDASNNITGATYNFVVNLNSFPTDSVWTLAHIHEGAAGVAGGVRVNTGLNTTGGPAPIPLTTGSISNQTFSNASANAGLDPAAIVNSMIANPSGWYFNAHSTRHPSGVVRGQLVKQ